MTTYTCEGCGTPCNEESVEFGGYFWCPNCAENHGATCAACGVLCERNELIEVGLWKENPRRWEIEHVEELCFLSFALALRAERVLRPVNELLGMLGDVQKHAFTADMLREETP